MTKYFLLVTRYFLHYLEGDGRLVRGEEGVPDELSLELLPVLAVHKLEHRLVHHVRLENIKESKNWVSVTQN